MEIFEFYLFNFVGVPWSTRIGVLELLKCIEIIVLAIVFSVDILSDG
jgi:hypothetical protein